MKKRAKSNYIRHIIFLVCLGFLLGLPIIVTSSEPQKTDDQEKKPIVIKKKESTFDYHIEGRPDPFLPFITERATSSEDPNEIVDEETKLTGMQLFEPSQLTLVALMLSDREKYAMVQDFTGKGYVIVEGTKIGRRGVVSQIIENEVIIEETARTRGGKILKNQIAMKLKKEEGEE